MQNGVERKERLGEGQRGGKGESMGRGRGKA